MLTRSCRGHGERKEGLNMKAINEKREGVMRNILIGLVLFLSGCALQPVGPRRGLIVSTFKGPMESVAANLSDKAEPYTEEKIGKATVSSCLGLFTWGDASINTAMNNGHIQKIHRVDYETTNFLILFEDFTLVVYGE